MHLPDSYVDEDAVDRSCLLQARGSVDDVARNDPFPLRDAGGE